MSISLRKMKECEITEIYEKHMCKDFPPLELKPLHSILDMMERGIYDSLLVYDGEEPVGYALVLTPQKCSYGLLDYLGVFSEKRNQNYGGRILASLKELYPEKKILIESEFPKDAPDQVMAERRLKFYQRNGAVDTGVESNVFGAHYVNMILGKDMDPVSAEEMIIILEKIYAAMMQDPVKRKKYLKFWVRD
ncbi:MAG: GNAT family N-acetyltransferase [Lachnospiraceae bacterium]